MVSGLLNRWTEVKGLYTRKFEGTRLRWQFYEPDIPPRSKIPVQKPPLADQLFKSIHNPTYLLH